MVKITYNGRSVTGRGLSVDIIEASARAYLNAINKGVNLERTAEASQLKNSKVEMG